MAETPEIWSEAIVLFVAFLAIPLTISTVLYTNFPQATGRYGKVWIRWFTASLVWNLLGWVFALLLNGVLLVHLLSLTDELHRFQTGFEQSVTNIIEEQSVRPVVRGFTVRERRSPTALLWESHHEE